MSSKIVLSIISISTLLFLSIKNKPEIPYNSNDKDAKRDLSTFNRHLETIEKNMKTFNYKSFVYEGCNESWFYRIGQARQGCC